MRRRRRENNRSEEEEGNTIEMRRKRRENNRNDEEAEEEGKTIGMRRRRRENNHAFFQLLADCPAYQRQFLLKTDTPQQLHALVQVLYNILMGQIPISEENKRILLPHKDALLNLARPNVPYKTKKRVLVQEGSNFI